MQEQLISYKTAILAKEKEFNELCEYSYEGSILHKTYKPWRNSEDNTEYAVTTQSLLAKWLREFHNIVVIIRVCRSFPYKYDITIWYKNSNNRQKFFTNDLNYHTYEEALEEGLYQALLLIETKRQ